MPRSNYFDSASGCDGSDAAGIIKREDILLPAYMPDELLHRDAELQMLADSIKPLLKRMVPNNLFIHGPTGCGKSACARYILKQLAEHSSAVLPVYVNCWENQTTLAAYNRIVEEMRLPLPRRGLATDEIFSRILQYMRNYKKPVLIVLDDMDGLKSDDLLFSVSRANSQVAGAGVAGAGQAVLFGIIGITNDRTLLASFDARVRSSLCLSELEFKPYTEDQLVSILRVRAEHALVSSSYDDRLLAKIARSAESSSVRLALELLWKSAKRAERAGRPKIMIQDLEDALSSGASFKLQELGLSDAEKLILELLKDGGLESSSLYSSFALKMPKTKRQIRNYLDELERKGLIESNASGTNRPIDSKTFSLRCRP